MSTSYTAGNAKKRSTYRRLGPKLRYEETPAGAGSPALERLRVPLFVRLWRTLIGYRPEEQAGPWGEGYDCSCDLFHIGRYPPMCCPRCGDRYPFRGRVSIRQVYYWRNWFRKEHIRWETTNIEKSRRS